MTAAPPLIIDCFAGGGGASTGIEMALGRSPDIAINHSAAALALHAANHPDTLHIDSNIWDVEPRAVTGGRPVGLLWASPDCKHFSKAKGAAVCDRNIRDLAWVVVRWAEEVRPGVILMENVEEFTTWGPVGEDGRPIRDFAGITFEAWVQRLRRAGYRVAWRELRACDFGAPTIRKRWFLVARRDGQPIVWPRPTHGDPETDAVRSGALDPWRTAADCIDWSIPCPSIFATSAEIMAEHGVRSVRPLAPATLARIARGMHRYVLKCIHPFILNLTHGARLEAITQPLRTVTAAHRGEKAVITAFLASLAHGDSGGRREYPLADPLGTITGGGIQHAVIAPMLIQTGYGERPGQAPRALDLGRPLGTVVAGGGKHALAAAFIAQQNGGPRMANHAGHRTDAPLSTITGRGSQQTLAAAFLAKYYGTGDGAKIGTPMHTITVRDRFGHVQAALQAPPFIAAHRPRAEQATEFLRSHGAWSGDGLAAVQVGGEQHVIIDIGLRMLTPRELYRAQGFPDDYVIEGVWDDCDGDWLWRDFPKTVQVSCCGNSVCPPIAAALAAANCPHLTQAEDAA